MNIVHITQQVTWRSQGFEGVFGLSDLYIACPASPVFIKLQSCRTFFKGWWKSQKQPFGLQPLFTSSFLLFLHIPTYFKQNETKRNVRVVHPKSDLTLMHFKAQRVIAMRFLTKRRMDKLSRCRKGMIQTKYTNFGTFWTLLVI